jgi:hypothetical protein
MAIFEAVLVLKNLEQNWSPRGDIFVTFGTFIIFLLSAISLINYLLVAHINKEVVFAFASNFSSLC